MLSLSELQDISTYIAPIEIPTFDALEIPPTPAVPDIPAAFIYRTYGTIIQDLIDGKITDFATYYTPIATVRSELALARHAVQQKYHAERKKFLDQEGTKNATVPSGRMQRVLLDLSLAERQDLSEATAKMVSVRLGESLDSLYSGAQAGIQSHASRFDEHHRLQSASLSVAKAATDAAIQQALLRVDQYNAWVDTIKAQYKAYKVQMEAYTQQMESGLFDIKASIVVAQRQAIGADLERLAAELRALQAQYEALQWELLVLQAERERQAALKTVADAELALAYIREVTVSVEMSKAAARISNVAVTVQRYSTMLTREVAEGTKIDTRLTAALAEQDIRKANFQLDDLRDQLEKLRIDTRTIIARIETASRRADALDDTQSANQIVNDEVSAQNLIYRTEAATQTMIRLQEASVGIQCTMLSLDKIVAIGHLKASGKSKVNSIERATEAAVESELHSELHYHKG